MAAGAAALKDATRRASARWPRKNEAILDRGSTRCLGMFRPGRENGASAEPENVGCGRWLAKASVTVNGGGLFAAAAGRVYRLWRPAYRRQTGVCLIFVSQGWGSVQHIGVHPFLSLFNLR
jgi:hypothetical protein